MVQKRGIPVRFLMNILRKGIVNMKGKYILLKITNVQCEHFERFSAPARSVSLRGHVIYESLHARVKMNLMISSAFRLVTGDVDLRAYIRA